MSPKTFKIVPKFVHEIVFEIILTYFFCLFLQPQNLCDIEQVTRIEVSKEDEVSYKIDIHLKDPDKEVCTLWFNIHYLD